MYKGSEEILRSTGFADRVIRFDFLNDGAFKALRFMFSLTGKYTHSVNVYPANRKEYNLISLLAGAMKRGAAEYKRSDFVNLGFINNITVPEDDSRHNAETNIMLVNKMFGFPPGEKPGLVFNTSDKDDEWAAEYLGKIRGDKRMVIGMHPGCSTLKNHIMRRWAPEKFAELADILSKKYNAAVLIFGGPEEDELKNYIKSKTTGGSVFVVNAPSLSKSAALIKLCSGFVTNDSSLMHVAAAMRVKTVAIIGPTNTSYIYPWGTEHRIASLNLECAPCFFYSPKPLSCSRTDVQFKCVRELTPEAMLKRLGELIPEFH